LSRHTHVLVAACICCSLNVIIATIELIVANVTGAIGVAVNSIHPPSADLFGARLSRSTTSAMLARCACDQAPGGLSQQYPSSNPSSILQAHYHLWLWLYILQLIACI